MARADDIDLLKRVVRRREELGDGEFRSFGDMLAKLEAKRGLALSQKQRGWLEQVAERLGESTALNLASRGMVEQGLPRADRMLPWEREGYTKPVKPPGRR